MSRRNARRRVQNSIAGVLFAVLAAGGVAAYSNGLQPGAASAERPSGDATEAPAPPTVTGDYSSVVGAAETNYHPAEAGIVEYCPLDALQRAVCAYAKLTSSQREQARATGRQSIMEDPDGWPSRNPEAVIPALPDVAGSKEYRGWFWNRSHLVADSLGGAPTRQNLITGTRTQNVGSTQPGGQAGGGMAYAERIARDYLDTGKGDQCPLYYAATPQYVGTEAIPRTVTVDLRTCDGSIDQHVEVVNTANGWQIDYRTGGAAEQ